MIQTENGNNLFSDVRMTPDAVKKIFAYYHPSYSNSKFVKKCCNIATTRFYHLDG